MRTSSSRVNRFSSAARSLYLKGVSKAADGSKRHVTFHDIVIIVLQDVATAEVWWLQPFNIHTLLPPLHPLHGNVDAIVMSFV
jgi:hypothetical protein